MSGNDERPRPVLRVVGGHEDAEMRSAEHGAVQLSLPGLPPSQETVVSVSFKHLLARDLAEVLSKLSIRTIVDIRLAPTFRALGFEIEDFRKHLKSQHLDYFWVRGERRRSALLSSVSEGAEPSQSSLLHELRDRMESGPLLLLSADLSGSDRDRFVQQLLAVKSGFQVVRLEA